MAIIPLPSVMRKPHSPDRCCAVPWLGQGTGVTFPLSERSATPCCMENLYARRREELMRRIGPRAVALIHGSRPARRNHDVEHKYRAPSDLLYLTGFGEPEAFA